MATKVFLWTYPRCVSTAFERSIREVENSKVFHEPYADAYYFESGKVSLKYIHKNESNPYDEIEKLLTKDYDVDLVFAKDMAYYIENHFERLLSNGFRQFQHTFLIRNPLKSIPSLYKGSIEEYPDGFNYFDPNEIGIRQVYELYHFLHERLAVKPIIIDADDLLMNPEETMKAYTNAIGIRYDPKILSWQPGIPADWITCNGWHDRLVKSTAFTKKSKEVVDKHKDITKLPVEVKQYIDDNILYYNHLLKCKINID